ncbi:MAG: hypothetical protein RQ761_08190 [Bacteroidales bacterium]|nr:hypothetical protein [Bacteroidales bacterium]
MNRMPGRDDYTAYLIGIDDTDNASSRGTGFLSRKLAQALFSSGLAMVDSITRHQLFVHPGIRYTSQNSSACMKVYHTEFQSLIAFCEDFILKNSAAGSDAGLCIAPQEHENPLLITWGNDAKNTILGLEEARLIADKSGLYLKGLTGNFEGMIGALAAVGLRMGGNDGRFIWRKRNKELRDFRPGIVSVKQVCEDLELDAIINLEGDKPGPDDRILMNDWVRPVLQNNKALLIVEKQENHNQYEWKLTPKEIIRSIS